MCSLLDRPAIVCLSIDTLLRYATRKHRLIMGLFPASGIFIFVGGVLACLLMIGQSRTDIANQYGFSTDMFTIFLLPPVIFDGCYSLKQVRFDIKMI